MSMIDVGIIGATGYAGEELVRLLLNHRYVNLKKVYTRDKNLKDFSFSFRNFYKQVPIECEELDWESIGNGVELIFSTLPYGVLMEHMSQDILDKVRIIDLGVDYRLMSPEEYKRYYRKKHKTHGLSEQFLYGLCEWNREEIKRSRNIANPGCFATVAELALLPLLKDKIIKLDNIIVDGKCGLSGGGRTLTLGTHYAEANESTKAYKLTDHPHRKEVEKAIKLFLGKEPQIVFTPHIVPMQRGILITAYCDLEDDIKDKNIKTVYEKYYENERFISLLDDNIYVETKWVKESNMCHINFKVDEDTRKIIITAAIDNLIKGAAGQAIQNMNIMYGIKEDEGIGMIPNCI